MEEPFDGAKKMRTLKSSLENLSLDTTESENVEEADIGPAIMEEVLMNIKTEGGSSVLFFGRRKKISVQMESNDANEEPPSKRIRKR